MLKTEIMEGSFGAEEPRKLNLYITRFDISSSDSSTLQDKRHSSLYVYICSDVNEGGTALIRPYGRRPEGRFLVNRDVSACID